MKGPIPFCDAAPGYYVSAFDGGRKALAAGPFATHAEALARVAAERDAWGDLDPRAAFAAWGTCRVHAKSSADPK